MNEDMEVTVTVTPEDMEFRASAKAAGLPDVLISVYGTALRRLVAAEREACAKLIEPSEEHRRDASWGYIGGEEGVELLDAGAAKIRARGQL